MNVALSNLAAILAMAVATYGTRVVGLWIGRHIPRQGRARIALGALPPAVLTAVIAPSALATGPAETMAAAVTIVAAMRLPVLATVAVGVGSVFLLRMVPGLS